jgi:hypothetical protein
MNIWLMNWKKNTLKTDQAMEALKIPEEEREKYSGQL